MDWVLLSIMILIVIILIVKYYNPKIEIVPLYKNYRVYLRYNKWEGKTFKRVCKYLFET